MPGWPDFDHWFPPVEAAERRPAPPFTLRHPVEDDHIRLLGILSGWPERPLRPMLAGLLLREMSDLSWLAETDDGRVIGMLLGLAGAGRPEEAAIALVGVDPAFRRRGIGRALVERFVADAGRRGSTRVMAAVRPDDRITLAFFAALGFEPDAGPGTVHIYGVPASSDWDGPGEDRAILLRTVGGNELAGDG
ncbi:MAG: GCN5-related N-acetyltransferase [Chloroflexi bacterium]|nr:GCN5-related N-acetyltransferase [Chloroflexota bacterium]